MTDSAPRKSSPAWTATPVWRRLFHLTAGSIVPVAAIFGPWLAIVGGTGVLMAISLSLDLVRFRYPPVNRLFLAWLRPLLKSDEDHHITGATYMLVASFIAFLAFDQPVAVTALLFLSVGDPVAALVGSRAPGPRLSGKSPVGTAAFVGVCVLLAAALAGSGAIQRHWGLLIGAVVAGLVELMPLPLDDNLTVPLISGTVMHLLFMYSAG